MEINNCFGRQNKMWTVYVQARTEKRCTDSNYMIAQGGPDVETGSLDSRDGPFDC